MLEGASLPYSAIKRFSERKDTTVIFLGKPNISQQDFFNEIRSFEANLKTGGWTKRLDDETLLSWCGSWIKKAQNEQEFCRENNIMFFDTSFNQMKVLNGILDRLKENNKD